MTARSGALELPLDPAAAALARSHVRDLGSGWPEQLVETALLVVSEVVTNAVRYGQGRLELEVTLSDGAVYVEVSDANPELPRRRPIAQDSLVEGGLGLHLLDALAAAWGTHDRADPPGKTVWVLLPAVS